MKAFCSFSTSVFWIAALLGNGARGRAEDVFTLGFEGPDALTARPGEKAEGIYAATLSHSGTGPGAQGWSISLVLDNASLEGIAIGVSRDTRNYPWVGGRTTDAGRLIDHLAEQSNVGFWFYLLTEHGDGECAGREGAIGAAFLSFRDPATLPPQSRSTIALIYVEASPMEAPFTAVLRYVDGCTEGQPVLNTIIQEGESKQPILGSKAISVAVEMFRRGDANSDLRVDISDAIRIFMHLFLGAASPGCLDAADANDDGRLDISAGLKILQDFFIPSTAISSPGPFTCGQDPTMDAFNCESYPPCS